MKVDYLFTKFGFNNEVTAYGLIRSWAIPEKTCEALQPNVPLKPSAKEVLRNIVAIWPQCNKSNVRIYVSYSGPMVSWDTTIESGEKVKIRGCIDYGVACTEKQDALETFFVVGETNTIGA